MTQKKTADVRNRRLAILAGAAALPLLLTACWNGADAQTSVQAPSGDGLYTEVGNMMIRNAVWVRDSKNATTLTLSATFVNTGREGDVLTSVTTQPASSRLTLTGGSIAMPGRQETRTAYNSDQFVNAYGIDVQQSGYVQTTFVFKDAGTVTGSVMTVPPEGIYAGISPSGSSEASPTARPSRRAANN